MCRTPVFRLVLLSLLLLLAPGAALGAGASDATPLVPALVPDAAGRTCQEAIGRASRRYASLKTWAVQHCLLHPRFGAGDAGERCRGRIAEDGSFVPPRAFLPRLLIAWAERRARDEIAGACTDELVKDLLLCGDTVEEVEECAIRGTWKAVDGAVEAEFGSSGSLREPPPVLFSWGPRGFLPGAGRHGACQRTIAREGLRYLDTKLRAVGSCLDRRNRSCTTGNAAELCIGELRDGEEVLPTDPSTARRIARAEERLRRRVGRVCTPGSLRRLDACADRPEALGDCLVGSHWRAAADVLAASYGGAERFADEASGIGPVVAAAEAGDTVLVDAGTYAEKFAVTAPRLSLVGQKTCEDRRPVIVNPAPGNSPNGIFACGSLVEDCGDGGGYGVPPGTSGEADGLLFQSLEVRDFDENDVFVIGADGVTFRDMVTTGPGTATGTEYGLFPVFSRHVLVEDSVVTGVRDAGIYVGEAFDIVVRNNEVFGNVAGIEIENSANARVYGNHAHGNSAGILVFKLPGRPVQLSACHEVRNNLVEENDLPNFGSGLVGEVPAGTGILIIADDDGVYEGNVVRGNDTFGIVITDQPLIDFITGSFDGDFSADPVSENAFFVGNVATGNGAAPALGILRTLGLAEDLVAVASNPLEEVGCASGNVFDGQSTGFASLPECVLPPELPACPVPFEGFARP